MAIQRTFLVVFLVIISFAVTAQPKVNRDIKGDNVYEFDVYSKNLDKAIDFDVPVTLLIPIPKGIKTSDITNVYCKTIRFEKVKEEIANLQGKIDNKIIDVDEKIDGLKNKSGIKQEKLNDKTKKLEERKIKIVNKLKSKIKDKEEKILIVNDPKVVVTKDKEYNLLKVDVGELLPNKKYTILYFTKLHSDEIVKLHEVNYNIEVAKNDSIAKKKLGEIVKTRTLKGKPVTSKFIPYSGDTIKSSIIAEEINSLFGGQPANQEFLNEVLDSLASEHSTQGEATKHFLKFYKGIISSKCKKIENIDSNSLVEFITEKINEVINEEYPSALLNRMPDSLEQRYLESDSIYIVRNSKFFRYKYGDLYYNNNDYTLSIQGYKELFQETPDDKIKSIYSEKTNNSDFSKIHELCDTLNKIVEDTENDCLGMLLKELKNCTTMCDLLVDSNGKKSDIDTLIFTVQFLKNNPSSGLVEKLALGKISLTYSEDLNSNEKKIYDIEGRLQNLAFSIRLLNNLTDFVRIQARYNGKDDCSKQFYSLISPLTALLKSSKESLSNNSNKLVNRLNANNNLRNLDLFSANTTNLSFKTRASYFIIPDFGLPLFMGSTLTDGDGRFKYITRPYFGVNLGIGPLNKDVRIRDIANKQARHYVSFNVGLTFINLSSEDGISDLYNNMSLLLGASIRAARPIRITSGIVLHKFDGHNPVVTDSKIGVMPFIALSLDVDLLEFFGKIGGKIFK